MPTYDYECNKCGKRFEMFQKITDSPATSCPKCKGKVRRLIGAGMGIIFKGSGFYETDYKRKNSSSGTSKKTESIKSEKKACPKEGCGSCQHNQGAK
ncbi:MAG: zinc ribbon domain-containing protein [Candidatus Omnitrophica bacterium]|nr:zinc ribbon domain-containing protein [Candidatus Omnitrophota bacterium]